ncbi:GNAT family N-acetyltransferase [Neorhizobium sp. SOG26]|uniref:GNAT family N-acetyltransferase n=1 Tax=Neorhizobium sp. SOG26 TaxID=2060726 RepID=UPI0018FF9C29|nr:GNAT family N-acetyltransferase [Neorhizobium sp. SOG26]
MSTSDSLDIELVIRSIEPGDNISGFVLAGKTNRPLKQFLRKEASHLETNSLARTYVLSEERSSDIMAFVTLIVGDVQVFKAPDAVHDGDFRFRYPSYPAIKVARLAVSDRHQGKRLGKVMIDFALGVAKEYICPRVGCRFATVDAKKQSVAFYEKCGFRLLDTPENLALDEPFMFMDLR